MSHEGKPVFTNLILDILREGSEMARRMQRENLDVEVKTDQSVVTRADRAIELMMRQRLMSLDTDQHQVFGEEDVDQRAISPNAFFESNKPYVWLLDPIAGTTCYAARIPLYAVSVGVLLHGRPLAGGVALPELGEVYWAENGQAWQARQAFSRSEERQPLAVLGEDVDAHAPLFHHSSRRIQKACRLSLDDRAVMALPAVNPGLMWTATRSCCASLVQLKPWDFAGAWPIMEAVGLRLRRLHDGAEMNSLVPDTLSQDWRMKNVHMFSNAATFSALQGKLMP